MGLPEKVTKGLHYFARFIQVAGALTVLGLSAYVATWYNRDARTASPSQVNFLVFVPCWTIVSIIYLEFTPRFAPRVANPYVSIFFESTNLLFYVAGSGALGHFLSRLLFCRGMVCHSARADAVVAGCLSLFWIGTLVVLVFDVFKVGFRKNSGSGIRFKPEMSAA